MPREPTERELIEYVRRRLERIGPQFAESEVVEEALELYRELWEGLWELDYAECDTGDRSRDTLEGRGGAGGS